MGLGAQQEKGLLVAAKGKGTPAIRDYNRVTIPESWKMFDDLPTDPPATYKGERATQEHIERWTALGRKVGLAVHLLEKRVGETIVIGESDHAYTLEEPPKCTEHPGVCASLSTNKYNIQNSLFFMR